jgi:alpha-ribazole phosphatase
MARIIDLLRHGEVEGGACFRGRSDDPLTTDGWSQLHAATRADAAQGAWDLIATSPLRRCAAFARALSQRHQVALSVMPALRERDFGAWEGLRADEIASDELGRFWADPASYNPPGAEPFAAFRARVLAGWDAVRDAGAGRMLVVTHGGVIRVIVGDLLGIPPPRLLLMEVPHACRTRLRVPAEGLPTLVSHGSLIG